MNYNYLANFLSGLSLVSGFASIIFSLESHFTFASWAIIFSVIFDGLDGQVARKNPVPSEFGKEFDSLIDVISFGIAPSILGYVFVYHNFYPWTAASTLLLYLFCSVMRLAKYNIMVKDKFANYFNGLPTTASGGILSSFILIYRRYTQSPPPFLFLFLVLMLAVLMVSKVKYLNLDGLKEAFGKSKILILSMILTAVVASLIFWWVTSFLLPEIAIFVLFMVYLFSPLFLKKFV